MLSACIGLSSAAVACFLPVLVSHLQLLHATCKVGLLFAMYKLQSIRFHKSQQLTLLQSHHELMQTLGTAELTSDQTLLSCKTCATVSKKKSAIWPHEVILVNA